jgi:hypothetical protein
VFIWPPAPTVIKLQGRTVTTAIITALLQLRDAKRVWVSCPGQSLCLEWAVLAGSADGVWGPDRVRMNAEHSSIVPRRRHAPATLA